MYDKDSEDSCHEVSPYLPALQDALQAQLQSQKVRFNPHIPAALPCSISALLILDDAMSPDTNTILQTQSMLEIALREEKARAVLDPAHLEEFRETVERHGQFLQLLLDNKGRILSRLQEPFSGDGLPCEQEYQSALVECLKLLYAKEGSFAEYIKAIQHLSRANLDNVSLEKYMNHFATFLARFQAQYDLCRQLQDDVQLLSSLSDL
jgi:hypothetical protein